MPVTLHTALEFTALLFSFALGGSVLLGAFRFGIGPVPSAAAARAVMLERVDPETAGTIVELGAGWGGLALQLAKRCPKAQVIAFEASLVPALFCRFRFSLSKADNVTVRHQDFMRCDLSSSQLLVCYLFRGGMQALERKLKQELPPGAQLISLTFALPNTPHTRVDYASDLYRSPVYEYRY
jgi:phospholipid N-methyltransferase